MLAAIALASTGCVSEAETPSSTTTTPSTTTTLAAVPADDQLVILTTDTKVVILDSDLEEVASIAPPEGSSYRQPIWLDADTILFAEVLVDGTGAVAPETMGARGDQRHDVPREKWLPTLHLRCF